MLEARDQPTRDAAGMDEGGDRPGRACHKAEEVMCQGTGSPRCSAATCVPCSCCIFTLLGKALGGEGGRRKRKAAFSSVWRGMLGTRGRLALLAAAASREGQAHRVRAALSVPPMWRSLHWHEEVTGRALTLPSAPWPSSVVFSWTDVRAEDEGHVTRWLGTAVIP